MSTVINIAVKVYVSAVKHGYRIVQHNNLQTMNNPRQSQYPKQALGVK